MNPIYLYVLNRIHDTYKNYTLTSVAKKYFVLGLIESFKYTKQLNSRKIESLKNKSEELYNKNKWDEAIEDMEDDR